MHEITHAPDETRVLGLEVGHLATNALSAESLAQALLAGRYDLCRVTVRADACIDAGVAALEAAAFPYCFAGAVLRFRRDHRGSGDEAPRTTPEGLEFHELPPDEHGSLKPLVRRCFADDPVGYHQTPHLAALVSKEAEIDCLLARHVGRENTQRRAVVVRAGGTDVGLIVMRPRDGILHVDLLGALSAHRYRGLYDAMRAYVHGVGYRHGMGDEHWVRYDDLLGLAGLQQDGLEHVATEAVFHVTPFLSHTVVQPRRILCVPQRVTVAFEEAIAHPCGLDRRRLVRRLVPSSLGQDVEDDERVSLVVRVPILTTALVLAVAEVVGDDGRSRGLMYAEYRTIDAEGDDEG